MKAFTPLVAAALLTASNAATVKLETTPCLQPVALENFEVTVDSLFVKEFQSVCGFKISSANGVQVNDVQCQAFKDKEGTTPGSIKFTQATPALIATNPVQINSIKCTASNSTAPGNGSSSIPTSTAFSTVTGQPPSPTGNAGQGNGNGANGTSSTAGPNKPPQPSQQPSQPAKGNGAEKIGMSAAVAGAVLVGMVMLGL